MDRIRVSPGPAANAAFRYGTVAGAVPGLVTIGLLYATGRLTLALAAYTLFILFPVYLVFVATLLSSWLGYGKDSTSLRPVYQERGSK
ncbi:hypothetical protein ACFO0N_21610 [Halobium salinum]|uniref:Uncharacterized protein n=1 Tax=Halobium salinum TaxID=1364940 RepID=A0ABD5PIC2_9EURY|nr:hypothetical protein [Halobium salinum]